VGLKVRTGIKWTAIGMLSSRLSRFGANIVLARLLAVEVFGVIAMANAAILLMTALREAGLGQAYVQRKALEDERESEAIDTVFAIMLLLNLVLFGAMLAVAPTVASFFSDSVDSVLPVVRALAVLFLLDTFVATPQYVLQRRMAFDSIARAEVTASLTNAILAIGAALAGAGVWALVVGQLGERIAMAVMLSRGARWRPGLRGSMRIARGLLHFGKYLWGYALVRSVGGVMDRVVVGRVHGAGGLGGYSQAYNLCLLPSTVISRLVNRVALPAMSRMQGDLPRLRAAFVKGLEHVAFLALPIGFGLFAVSDVFVPVVYGEKWRFIAPIVDVLAGFGTVLAVASVCGPALQALGKPRVFFYTELGRQALLLVLLILFASRGEVAVAWAILAALVVATLFAFIVLGRLLALRMTTVIVPVSRSLVASLGMAALVLGVRHALPASVGEPLELAIAVVVGIVGYPATSAICNRPMMQSFLRTVREVGSSRSAVS